MTNGSFGSFDNQFNSFLNLQEAMWQMKIQTALQSSEEYQDMAKVAYVLKKLGLSQNESILGIIFQEATEKNQTIFEYIKKMV